MFAESMQEVGESNVLSPSMTKRSVNSVLFISHTSRVQRPYYDPSVRYRCFNVADNLHRQGLKTHVISQVELERTDILPAFDAYVFHRPKLTRGLLKFLERLPATSTKVADYDDLVFDVEATEFSSAVRSRNEPIWSVRSAISENYGAFTLFDQFSVSTQPLKDAVLRLNPSATVFVTPNVPDQGYMALAQVLRKRRAKRAQPRIGYFSGTTSHNEDLRMVSDAISDFCLANRVEFFLMGPVQVPPSLRRDGIVLQTCGVKSFQEMASEVTNCDFVIAPLTDSKFNDCKSAIKFMESAVLGVPIVATPIPDVARFESSLLYRAEDSTSWAFQLNEAWQRNRSADLPAAEKVETQLLQQSHLFSSLLSSI